MTQILKTPSPRSCARTVTLPFFYGLEVSPGRPSGLYQVFARPDAICGARVAGQIHDEATFHSLFAGQAEGLGALFSPLMRRWLRQRREREQLYESIEPGSPKFLATDRRNFVVRREDVERVVLTDANTFGEGSNCGAVGIVSKDGRRRVLVLIGDQDLGHVEDLVGRSLGRLDVRRTRRAISNSPPARECPRCRLINLGTAQRCDCGSVLEAGRPGSSDARNVKKSAMSTRERWVACWVLGLGFILIAGVFTPLSFWLTRPVPFESLRVVDGEVERVGVTTAGARYLSIQLKGWTAELRVNETSFVPTAEARLLALSAGERIRAWLAPDGWLRASRNNVWQLYRADETPASRGAGQPLLADYAVVDYGEMVEAVAASGAWSRLFLTWGLATTGTLFVLVGLVGTRLTWRGFWA